MTPALAKFEGKVKQLRTIGVFHTQKVAWEQVQQNYDNAARTWKELPT
jgi:hypothetical protein